MTEDDLTHGQTSPLESHLTPVSKAEMEALKEQLARPQLRLELTPEGPVIQAVHAEQNQQIIERINHIRDRLAEKRNQARDDFNRAKEKGRARDAFRRAR